MTLQNATAMKLMTILFTSSLLTGCMIGDEGGASGQNDGDILYGADDYGDPAVGMIRNVTDLQLNGAPAGFNVAPIARGPLPAIGSAVTGVGYGANSFAVTGFGTKRIGTFTVTAENQHEVAAGHDGNNVCHGDSGGPIFQNGLQVGVASYVDTADCHGGGHFMRIDDSIDFIHQYVPSY